MPVKLPGYYNQAPFDFVRCSDNISRRVNKQKLYIHPVRFHWLPGGIYPHRASPFHNSRVCCNNSDMTLKSDCRTNRCKSCYDYFPTLQSTDFLNYQTRARPEGGGSLIPK